MSNLLSALGIPPRLFSCVSSVQSKWSVPIDWLHVPSLKASGFSEITQCPASMSANSNLGKNCPMIGNASSGIYLLCVPRTNNARFGNRTSPGFLNGKSPRLSSAAANILKGTLNFCSLLSAGRCKLPSKNCRMGRDCQARH